MNSGNTAISSPAIDQSFTLDETGNFTGFNESGSSVSTLNQTRVHDTVNEITNISQSSGTAWATPNHDASGNMTVIPNVVDSVPESSFTATWDAWNRLIKLADDGDTVASYQYDGNNRRIVVRKYAANSAIEDRHVYFSSGSQALEERVDTASTADTQFVWSLGSVDDLMLRDKGIERLYALNDLRFSIVALANTSGTIVERYDYDGHGVATVLDSAFVERPNGTSHDWQFRYTGKRQDLNTGLYYFRARYFHAQLGRFISRDPLGFADGMSLYRGYFAPKSTDLFGLFQDPQIGDLESQVIVANAWAIVQIQYAHLFVQLRTNSCVVQAPIPQPGMLWGTGFQNQAADGSYVIGVGTMTIPGHDVLPVSDMTISALVHELIHVVDDCNGEGGTCDWIVCLEIRAASGGPQCSSLGEEFSPEWIQCVKDSAIASVTTYFNNNPQCWAGNQDELGYVDGLVNNQFTRCVLSPECVTGGLPDFPEV